jgi:hypothetical protein
MDIVAICIIPLESATPSVFVIWHNNSFLYSSKLPLGSSGLEGLSSL